MKALGADETIDYQTEDFTKLVSDVDLVVNLTGPKTLENSYQVIKKVDASLLLMRQSTKKKRSVEELLVCILWGS